MFNKLIIEDWGKIDYQQAWNRQSDYQQKLVGLKRAARQENVIRSMGRHFLILCEHAPVYTMGKSGKDNHLLVDQEFLEEHGITFYKINRGGDITFHGPGQLVAYPILDLEFFFTDIHRYIRTLEEVVIRTLANYNISGYRIEEFTGVWTGRHPSKKICAIGVHMSRWVSMHGLAFNINTDLSKFSHIVPCGINEADMAVTSLSQELNQDVDMDEIKFIFADQFVKLFKINECEKRKSHVIPSQS